MCVKLPRERTCARRKQEASRTPVLHTLRHTALSRMIAEGYDDYTVMEISGHSSTQVHPSN